MRIQTKFSLFSSLLVTLLALGISSAIFVLQRRNLIEDFIQRQREVTRTFAAVCSQALAISDMLFLINYLKVLKDIPGIEWAYLADAEGKILIHTDERFIYKPLSEWEAAADQARFVERGYPVSLQGQVRGQARVGFSKSHIEATIQSAIARTLRWTALVALIGVAAGLGASWALASYMARPIRDLAQGSRQVEAGELEVSVPVRTGDELGELAAQFNRMTQRLKEIDELKEEFISMVSHDLKSPLSSIKMHLDYLLSEARGELNAQQQEMLRICGNAAASLGVFIGNILDTAKIKAGKMEYAWTDFRLREALEPVLGLVQVAVQQKNISLQVPELSRSPLLAGDRDRIEHVFANLLSNAVKHTPPGERIRVDWSEDPSAKTARIVVANTGVSIPKEELDSLFEKFYQADLSRQKRQRIKGTGLGLSLVKRTIEDHRGSIRAESSPEIGVRFEFSLPLAGASPQKENLEHAHG